MRGKLISLHDNTRAFDGYILICDDPGPVYTQVVFRSHIAARHHLLLAVGHTYMVSIRFRDLMLVPLAEQLPPSAAVVHYLLRDK